MDTGLLGVIIMVIGAVLFIWLKGKKATVGALLLFVGFLLALGVIPT